MLPIQEDRLTQPFNGCLHPDLKNLDLHAWHLKHPPFRNKDEVAARFEAPQRLSTCVVYKSKWAKVDFGSLSVIQIVDFLLQDRRLQLSTIEGYKMTIADMVDNDKFNISRDENVTCLLDSYHRDKPKGRRGVPTWNTFLVFH